VAATITRESLLETARILHRDLRHKFGLAHPRILVAGLNPHAGEGGHLGHEENDVIIPALAQEALIPLVPGKTLNDTVYVQAKAVNIPELTATYVPVKEA